MAFCFPERACQHRFVERMLGDLSRQLRRGGAVERAQRDHRQQVVVLELPKQPYQRRVVLLLFSPHGADDQTAGVYGRAHEIVKPFDRVAVRPLQIVKHEDERCSKSKRLRERFEES